MSLSVGSDPPGADTVGAKQGSRLHDVCTLTVPHCSSKMDSVCSGASTMNHHLVFSPLILNLRLTRRPDGETWVESRHGILDCSNSAAPHCSPNSSCTWDPCVVVMVAD